MEYTVSFHLASFYVNMAASRYSCRSFSLKSQAFLDVTLSLGSSYRCFTLSWCLHLQGQIVLEELLVSEDEDNSPLQRWQLQAMVVTRRNGLVLKRN